MNEADENLLKEAADKEGFSLQARTAKIFEKKEFITYQDFPIRESSPIDVFSYPRSGGRHNSVFVIECKGSSTDKPLLLFDNSSEIIKSKPNMHKGIIHHLLSTLRYEQETGFFYAQPDPTYEKIVIICAQETSVLPNNFRYCISGDFRQKNKANWYEKMPRHDDKNNLFKGISQTIAAIPRLQEKINEIANAAAMLNGIQVIPLIVTNAKIFIRDHDAPAGKEIIEVDWAIHQCERPGSETNPVEIKYVFIVNIEKLDTFIDLYA